jgi:hypothetical protein
MPQLPRNWLEHVLQRSVPSSISECIDLPALEKDLAGFHQTMGLGRLEEWQQHVIGTLLQEDRAKVILPNTGMQYLLH